VWDQQELYINNYTRFNYTHNFYRYTFLLWCNPTVSLSMQKYFVQSAGVFIVSTKNFKCLITIVHLKRELNLDCVQLPLWYITCQINLPWQRAWKIEEFPNPTPPLVMHSHCFEYDSAVQTPGQPYSSIHANTAALLCGHYQFQENSEW